MSKDLRIKLQDKSTAERCVSDPQENLRLEPCVVSYCCCHGYGGRLRLRPHLTLTGLCSDVKQRLEKCTGELLVKEEELQRCQQELLKAQKALEKKEREMEEHVKELQSSRVMLKELEVQMQQGAQDLEESRSMVRQQEQELARVKEVLRRTEEELDQRVALMSERCLVLEEERGLLNQIVLFPLCMF